MTNIDNEFRKKSLKFLEAENVLRLKVSRGRNCLGAESVSQLFSGLKVSPDWKFLPAESFSKPQVSQGWKCLPAESFSEPQVSQGWNCRNWKCLRAESVFHPHGWKCLAAENVWAANFSRWKLSQGWKCLRDANNTKGRHKPDTNYKNSHYYCCKIFWAIIIQPLCICVILLLFVQLIWYLKTITVKDIKVR